MSTATVPIWGKIGLRLPTGSTQQTTEKKRYCVSFSNGPLNANTELPWNMA